MNRYTVILAGAAVGVIQADNAIAAWKLAQLQWPGAGVMPVKAARKRLPLSRNRRARRDAYRAEAFHRHRVED